MGSASEFNGRFGGAVNDLVPAGAVSPRDLTFTKGFCSDRVSSSATELAPDAVEQTLARLCSSENTEAGLASDADEISVPWLSGRPGSSGRQMPSNFHFFGLPGVTGLFLRRGVSGASGISTWKPLVNGQGVFS